MPQNSPLTIKDGQTTPADHVFSPTRIEASGMALFAERTTGKKIGEPTLSFQIRQPNRDSNAYKAYMQINVPKVVSVTDAQGRTKDVVDYQMIAKAEFVFPPASSKQERLNSIMLLANGLTHTTLKAALADLESFW